MPKTITIKKVAQLLECTEETVQQSAAAGKLAAVKFGRSWVFLRDSLFDGLHQTALANLRGRSAVAPLVPASNGAPPRKSPRL